MLHGASWCSTVRQHSEARSPHRQVTRSNQLVRTSEAFRQTKPYNQVMAHKDVHGKCPLCLKRRKLCKSHYLGRVLHKLSFTGSERPVVMTPKLIATSQRQLWAHLLCVSCEQRLNDRGEKPVQALFNGANSFPLLNRMEVAMAVKTEPTVVTYSGSAMGIDTEPLAYYALSILWKGSVHKWTTLKGQKSSITLGQHQEPIRRYLIGETGFPDGVYVIATACTDVGSQEMVFAPNLMAGTQYPMHSILARGLWFHIITADQIVPGLDNLCCFRSGRRILHKADCTEPFLQAGRFVHQTAVVSPELRR